MSMPHPLSASARPLRRAASPRLMALFAPLDVLLASGGDPRLAVDPDTKLNGYGCRPTPRPEAFTFASSTATSISERAYAAAGAAREVLFGDVIAREDAFDARLEHLRARLADALGLAGTGVAIVLSPSGTDAQLQALAATQACLGGPITSIVVAADETGSGTGFALTGRHFNTATSHGTPVAKGEPLAGFGDVARIDIPLTDETGHRRGADEIDAAVEAAVASAIRAGRKVLLQTMDRSKLWRRAPSRACLDAIAARWPDAVQIVVDACQLRTSPARLNAALARGEMVLITGSKYFTGPPFSGALLVPEMRADAVAHAHLPEGLGAYFHAGDWPTQWRGLRTQLTGGFNAGQWLRWEAALAEIEAYRAVPQAFRTAAIADFCKRATRSIEEAGFELLDDEAPDTTDPDDDGEFAPRTILPFIMRRTGNAISRAEAAGLYRALNCDVSDRLPPGVTAEERAIAAQLCHIGQPVAIRTAGGEETAVLRISAGARILSDSWCGDEAAAARNLYGEAAQVHRITAKLRLLLAHGIAL